MTTTEPTAEDERYEALLQLKAAIYNEGPDPRTHRQVMARHRSEWPTLWAAIDRLSRLDT